MESEDEEALFAPDYQTLDPTTCPLTLGFALAFGLLLVRCPSKPLVVSIKLADGVIKGAHAFRYPQSSFPTPGAVFLASKALIKGFKVSKRLFPTGSPAVADVSPLTARKLKACVASVNLLRYAYHLPHSVAPMGLGFLGCGHKISKNLLKILDGFVGLQLDDVVRRSVDALGLLVKTAIIAREIDKQVGSNGRALRQNKRWFWRVPYRRLGIYLHCKRSHVYGFHLDRIISPFGLVFGNYYVSGVEQMEVSVSELLSLSIPLEGDTLNQVW